jgi:hypothetical protein
MHVQAPWAYVDVNGNTWIKDNAHVTCTHNVDVIEVTASLLRQEVAAGSNPELLKTQTVDCTNADYCQAIVKFDVPDNPSKVWVWWEHANGYIKDADGFDHDVKDSGYLAWPWE